MTLIPHSNFFLHGRFNFLHPVWSLRPHPLTKKPFWMQYSRSTSLCLKLSKNRSWKVQTFHLILYALGTCNFLVWVELHGKFSLRCRGILFLVFIPELCSEAKISLYIAIYIYTCCTWLLLIRVCKVGVGDNLPAWTNWLLYNVLWGDIVYMQTPSVKLHLICSWVNEWLPIFFVTWLSYIYNHCMYYLLKHNTCTFTTIVPNPCSL